METSIVDHKLIHALLYCYIDKEQYPSSKFA